MSDIPKSKRAYSNLEAHHKALEIRRKIAVELLASFAYSEKKLEEAVRKQTQHIQDPEHRAEAAQAIRNLEEDFACWFIKRHRDRVDDLCCDIAQHLRGANTIWPTYHFEYKDRRGELNQALKCCNKLQDELQYIAESLPADKNKYMDIGSQPSQNIGIVYPYRLDNYAKIVKAVKGYGRYTDDSYAIARTREELLELLDGLEKEAKEYGLIINRKKTRIVKLSSEFRHLQVCYSLTETGRVIRKISPKNITRERRKLKAYKRLLDSGRIDYATVENAFKSWLGSHWKYMSHDQVYNMSSLYYELFGRRPKWKKGHGRLHWLMAHPSTASTSTGTTTSAPPPSPRPPSPVSSPA